MSHYQLIEFTDQLEGTLPAVEKRKGRLICNRCGNQKQRLFYKDDYGNYCEQCLIFGKSSTYATIERIPKPALESVQPTLTKMIYLSELQQLASRKCIDWYQKKEKALVFAVCGAGKTELVYDVLLKAVSEQKRVCFATPRKDVVLELYPRLKRDFEHVSIVALYGGSPDRGKDAHIIISTTHQLINFYQYFDLVILDEVDAFPYYNNDMLESFVEKAKKVEAPLLYLTATPTKKLKKEMANGKLNYFIIPSRFHRHPIPLPKVSLVKQLNHRIQNKKLPKLIMDWLNEKVTLNKQVFIFVPSIAHGKSVKLCLSEMNLNCEFVSSESRERKPIVQAFRDGEIQFLITTTILERGVTVSNVDVCILLACDEIFDERAIVQIIGRAGRDKNYPEADVRLFCEDYTIGIKDAIKHIKGMNKKNDADKRRKP